MLCAACQSNNEDDALFCEHCGQPLEQRCPACGTPARAQARFCRKCGIMALFGAPIAHEDHALRACYAALAMQTALRDYADEVRRTHGMALRLRVGLNAGEVVVRAIGNDLHMDYSTVGQTVHLAARMEQLAAPGSVLLTAATFRLVEGLMQVKALGSMPVKGLPEPMEVCELVGASNVRRLQAAVARGLTRFVGREPELAALTQALAQAGSGHGQIVALVGEAGVGKSRLVYECVHWRDCVGAGRSPSHWTQGWRVLEAASMSYGKATPYFPVLELLRRYAHVEEHDDTRTIRAKVTGQALTLADELGMRPLQAHCYRGLGTLYVTTGQREQARAELSAAIALYRAMDMTFWLPQTEVALAQVERRPG